MKIRRSAGDLACLKHVFNSLESAHAGGKLHDNAREMAKRESYLCSVVSLVPRSIQDAALSTFPHSQALADHPPIYPTR